MREMMTSYGAGGRTPEQEQKQQSRATTGLIIEVSPEYEKYDRIGTPYENPDVDDHSNRAAQNLVSLNSPYVVVKNLSNLGKDRY